MSFAPSELQKEIAALSSEIEAQKAILDDLIGRRSRAQRNLNAVLDPMARLPLELQSKIFVLCLPDDRYKLPSRPNPKLAPMLVSNVCHLWQDIALSTPELWTHVWMESSPRPANYFLLYGIWLERSCSLPVFLILESTSVLAEAVKRLVDRAAPRVEQFSLHLSASPHDEYRIPRLPFQSLKRLNIAVQDQKPFNVYDWIDFMRMSPGLSYFSFSASFSRVVAVDFQFFTLAALKELHLGEHFASDEPNINPTMLLKYITLPALETLGIHCCRIIPDLISDFTAFILRSSPPLRSLAIDCTFRVRTPTVEYLYAVPTLETLTLSTSDCVSVLERLATAPAFLPRLQHLTCSQSWMLTRDDFEVVVRMFSIRSLRTFRLNFLFVPNPFGGSAEPPDEDILVELRRIRDSGVDIYIGDKEQNLV
ncbi:hypothetical protein R3P38DRAFT_1118775 [Favolaschia claudopus]|uniref:F-box domain-containing protein n=1 Tax=Favolaschia claudopus TaxID=2862362 RepID=A0AAW0B8I3_9AGAR